MIKKRQYWPSNVPGDDIENHFEGEELGAVEFLETNTDEGKAVKIHCIMEPDYVMKLMASWITLNDLEGANSKRDWKENEFRSQNYLSTNNLLVCTRGTGTRLTAAITGNKNQYLLKQRG